MIVDVARSAGRITVVKKSILKILEGLKALRVPADSVKDIAQAISKADKAARLLMVLKYGGRVLFVIGLAGGIIRIVSADDKLKVALEVGGGMAGAWAFGAAAAAWTAPSEAAPGPGTVVHVGATVIASIAGYFVGEAVAKHSYEFAVGEESDE